MKKINQKLIALAAITGLMFSSFTYVQAQTEETELKRVEFGLRYMPTFIKLDLRDSKGNDIPGSVSFQQGFGVMLGVNVNTHIGVQVEVNYAQISQKYKDVDVNRKVKIRYVNVPLLLSLNTSKSKQFNLNVVAGPELGFNTGADLSSNGTGGSDTLNAVLVLKKGNIGLAYGAGLEFALNPNHTVRFDLGYRGFYSFVDVTTKTNSVDSYNAVVKIPRARNGAYVGLTVQF